MNVIIIYYLIHLYIRSARPPIVLACISYVENSFQIATRLNRCCTIFYKTLPNYVSTFFKHFIFSIFLIIDHQILTPSFPINNELF